MLFEISKLHYFIKNLFGNLIGRFERCSRRIVDLGGGERIVPLDHLFVLVYICLSVHQRLNVKI